MKIIVLIVLSIILFCSQFFHCCNYCVNGRYEEQWDNSGLIHKYTGDHFHSFIKIEDVDKAYKYFEKALDTGDYCVYHNDITYQEIIKRSKCIGHLLLSNKENEFIYDILNKVMQLDYCMNHIDSKISKKILSYLLIKFNKNDLISWDSQYEHLYLALFLKYYYSDNLYYSNISNNLYLYIQSNIEIKRHDNDNITYHHYETQINESAQYLNKVFKSFI